MNRFLKAGDIRGAKFGFRRPVLDGLDPPLGAGTPLPAEDIEFVGRAVAKGYRSIYAPGPTVRHDHGRGEQHAAELMRKYDIDRGA